MTEAQFRDIWKRRTVTAIFVAIPLVCGNEDSDGSEPVRARGSGLGTCCGQMKCSRDP
jgi:hypothetical protein